MTGPTYACDAIIAGRNGQPRTCSRKAVWSWLMRGGTMLRYCAQHDAGAGSRVSRLLMPERWLMLSRVRTSSEV
jgi:hypothetical protein